MARGIAGIVAAILLIVVLAAAIVLIISVQRQLTQAQETAAKISLERQQLSLALQNSLFSYMIVYTNLSKATLLIRNAYTQPVLLKGFLVVYTQLNYTFAQPLGTGYSSVLYNESLVECPTTALPVTPINLTSAGVELDPGCSLYINFTYTLEPATATAVAYAGPSTLAAAATVTAKKLYPWETAAAGVTATATTTATTTTPPAAVSLYLYYRPAIVADNFSTNPFTAGRLLVVSGGTNWTWSPAGFVIYDANTTEGLLNGADEAVAVFNLTSYVGFLGGFVNESLPSSKEIYYLARVVVNAWNVTAQTTGSIFNRFYNETGEADLYFSNTTSIPTLFIVSGLYRHLYWYRLPSLVAVNSTVIVVYNYTSASGWSPASAASVLSELNDSLGIPLLYRIGIAYDAAAAQYAYNFSLLNATTGGAINETSGLVGGGPGFNITAVGLGTWYANVSFDDVLVTVGADPFFINVTGLPGSGWNVTLIEYSGSTPVYVVSGVSDASGSVYLNLTNPSVNAVGRVLYMFCDAVMEVYTPTGVLNTTLSSSSVPGGCFLGGDVYRYG